MARYPLKEIWTMPITIRADRAQPGLRLAEPFLSRGQVMLPSGKVLTDSEVDQLRRQFSNSYLQISEPILDHAVEFEDISNDKQIADLVQRSIVSFMTEVERQFEDHESISCDIHGTGHDDFSVLSEAISRLVKFMEDHPISVAYLNQDVDDCSYLAMHSAHVFYLSLSIALALRSQSGTDSPSDKPASEPSTPSVTDANLFSLGLGAMYADVGMIPYQHLFKNPGKLTPKNRRLLSQHPVTGAQMLPRDFSPTTKMIVKTHHENYDGTGYPNAIQGNRQHLLARIVRIADAYTAATNRQIYPDAGSSACVLWEMACGPCKHFYDPQLVKILTRLIQPFPIGSMLKLHDERTAVVVRHNQEDPFSPVVVIAVATNGKRLPANQLDPPVTLDAKSGLRIKSFEGEDLSFIYEQEPVACTSSCHCSWTVDHDRHTTMFEAAFP